MKQTVYFCKECFTALSLTEDIIPGYEGIYECSNCGHPQTKEEANAVVYIDRTQDFANHIKEEQQHASRKLQRNYQLIMGQRQG